MPEVTPETMREWRLGRNLTQEEVAERLGVTQATVAKWESGALKPKGLSLRFWHLLVGGFIAGAVLEAMKEMESLARRGRKGPRVDQPDT